MSLRIRAQSDPPVSLRAEGEAISKVGIASVASLPRNDRKAERLDGALKI